MTTIRFSHTLKACVLALSLATALCGVTLAGAAPEAHAAPSVHPAISGTRPIWHLASSAFDPAIIDRHLTGMQHPTGLLLHAPLRGDGPSRLRRIIGGPVLRPSGSQPRPSMRGL